MVRALRTAPVGGALLLGFFLALSAYVGRAVGYGSTSKAMLLATLPLIVIGLGSLAASNRVVLLFAALGLGLTIPALQDPLPIGTSGSIYAADLIVLLTIGAWFVSRALGGETRERPERPAALGWPFALFAVIIAIDTYRGHDQYGASLVGQPLRFIIYAAIALAVVDLRARDVYDGLVLVFYAGTVWQVLSGLYYLATSSSQTQSVYLSTGGSRYLALTTSLYLAGALFLALLNLALDLEPQRRLLHMAIALLATFGVVLAFGRGTFAAVAVVGTFLFLVFPRVRVMLLWMIPLVVPLLVATTLTAPKATETVTTTFTSRVSRPLGTDSTVQWRKKANEAIWKQVREEPVIGVGFGKHETFFSGGLLYTIPQNPHNDFTYLLAGGGILALGSFLLVCLMGAFDGLRRLRTAVDSRERLIIWWSLLTLFAVLLNSLAEPLLSEPSVLLFAWALLVLPAVVPRRRTAAV